MHTVFGATAAERTLEPSARVTNGKKITRRLLAQMEFELEDLEADAAEDDLAAETAAAKATNVTDVVAQSDLYPVSQVPGTTIIAAFAHFTVELGSIPASFLPVLTKLGIKAIGLLHPIYNALPRSQYFVR